MHTIFSDFASFLLEVRMDKDDINIPFVKVRLRKMILKNNLILLKLKRKWDKATTSDCCRYFGCDKDGKERAKCKQQNIFVWWKKICHFNVML